MHDARARNATGDGRWRDREAPRISFCVALMNRGENFLKMLQSWKDLDDPHRELIVADFGSTDIDVRPAVAGAGRVRIAQLPPPFNRSRGLNAAAACARGELLFFLDADIILPKEFCSTIRAHVRPGQAYFPICYSLHEASPADPSAPGWWRKEGYGMCGFHHDDFRRLRRWDESFVRWGGEDNELFGRARTQLKVVREFCPGLLHVWHPDDLFYKERYHNAMAAAVEQPANGLGSHCKGAGEKSPRRDIVTWNVVVPCFNYGRYLEQAVRSALANPVDLVVTIVDDASTDDTARVAAGLVASDRRVTYLRHRSNVDVSASRNDGVAARASMYAMMLDADDYLSPSYLREAEALLGDYDVVCPDMILVGECEATWKSPEYPALEMLIERNCVHGPSAFRRQWWERVGGFDEKLPNWQDYDFWISLAKRGARFRRLPGRHYFYRKHGPSKSDRGVAHRTSLREYLRRKHDDVFGLDSATHRPKTRD